MESIHVIIAELSQLTRLGITAIIKQLGYPFTVREIIHPDRPMLNLNREQKALLIISNSFLNKCSADQLHNLSVSNRYIARVLIQDSGKIAVPDNIFNEVIEPEDNDKAIFKKLERQFQILLKPDLARNTQYEISDREKEVLQLVALGMTNKEIAEKLFISSHTVITHRKNITAKLGIKTIAGLTVYAIIHKLIAPDEFH